MKNIVHIGKSASAKVKNKNVPSRGEKIKNKNVEPLKKLLACGLAMDYFSPMELFKLYFFPVFAVVSLAIICAAIAFFLSEKLD